MNRLWDIWAKNSAKKYCIKNDLEFIEVKPFPNHYGLYFKKNEKKYYAGFDYEMDRTIHWKKKSPLEIIKK